MIDITKHIETFVSCIDDFEDEGTLYIKKDDIKILFAKLPRKFQKRGILDHFEKLIETKEIPKKIYKKDVYIDKERFKKELQTAFYLLQTKHNERTLRTSLKNI